MLFLKAQNQKEKKSDVKIVKMNAEKKLDVRLK